MSTPIVPLGQLCEMDRQGLQPDNPTVFALPYVGVEHVESESGDFNFKNDSRIGSQRSTSYRFDERHILYAKLRPYLNKVATPGFAGRCSTELVPLLPRDGVDREFVAYLLRRKETVNFVMSSVTGSRMPRTDMRALMSLPVPQPPLDHQRRIVGILNRAAKIERLRKRTQERLREFIPALFVKMFGDPSENPMGWDKRRLEDLVRIRGGKRLPKGSRYSDRKTPHRYIRAADITAGKVIADDPRYISKDLQTGISRYIIHSTDTLITIAGKIGITAPAESHLAGANLTENAAYLTPLVSNTLHNVFLSAQLNSESVQDQILIRTGRVTIGKLALHRIKSISVLVPPFDQQLHFAEMVNAAQAAAEMTYTSSMAASTLGEALVSRLL
ncbi:MAG: restriction endonuclease subunit S [Gemmatimonadetes bacterium]|nr:restriction endonuclease subunit S [Gemmatimonadota bacterium]